MGQLTLMLFLKEDWARSADPEPFHFLSDNTAPQVLEVHAREMGCRLHPALPFLERPGAVQIAALRKGTREAGGHSFPRPLSAGRWVLGKLVRGSAQTQLRCFRKVVRRPCSCGCPGPVLRPVSPCGVPSTQLLACPRACSGACRPEPDPP